jgi:2-dehydro-3-deoxygluconokinase
MSKKCVALGEVLLRLKAPGFERLFQTPALEATFGGGEANALVSLANYGWDTEMLTGLPDNEIGDAAIAELARHQVRTLHVARKPGRLGSYYLETGAAQRPANVVYDRAGSVFSALKPADIDLSAAFDGADVLLVSGITPAVSQAAADIAIAALAAAKQRGMQIVVDFNYRSKLWNYGVEPPEVMEPMTRLADVIVAGIEDIQIMLGLAINEGGCSERVDRFKLWAEAVFAEYPNVSRVVCSLRESLSASHNRLGACMVTRGSFYQSKTYDITQIIDRVGAGDALVGALIHGLYGLQDEQHAIEFAAAAGCLKHSVPGDYNRVSENEVLALVGGDGAGRVLR